MKPRQFGALALLILTVIFGIASFVYIFGSDDYLNRVSNAGSEKLKTNGWENALTVLNDSMPSVGERFAYYELKEGENLAKVSDHFGVPIESLQKLNPGKLLPGLTIKIPPVVSKLEPVRSNGLIGTARVSIDEGKVVVRGDYGRPKINTTIEELADYLADYSVLNEVGDGEWQLLRPLSIEENIRIDFLANQVSTLSLRSDPNDIVCLCFENSEVLFDGVTVTTFQSNDGNVDVDAEDQRSYVRARKSTRMDTIDSTFSYLGNGLDHTHKGIPIQNGGGVYGVSWRIPDERLGKDIVTGWIENTLFTKNHFGSYTYGASGMMWLNNNFSENDVYGLDPHDDSNNATIEGNLFERNGNHGFIVSKRCNYNIIRNNVSKDNALHGFMLHQDSVYNIIENNLAENNVDNYVIYESSYNIIRNNTGSNPESANVRINATSANNYILDNNFYGGENSINLYDDTVNTLIRGNNLSTGRTIIKTREGVDTVVIADNTVSSLDFSFQDSENVIYGENTVSTQASNRL